MVDDTHTQRGAAETEGDSHMARFAIDEGYALPIFADGSVRFIVTDGGERAFSVAHGVRGDTRAVQEENIAAGRAKLQEMIDLANKGAAA
jgi:hypothetical protein